jgi:hypothetical protein
MALIDEQRGSAESHDHQLPTIVDAQLVFRVQVAQYDTTVHEKRHRAQEIMRPLPS